MFPRSSRVVCRDPERFAVEQIKYSYWMKEAVKALGTSERAVWSFIRRGDFPTCRLIGLDRTLIKASNLIAFVDDQPSVYRNKGWRQG